ncbi:MAG: BlaI/MecI/CopY family transcriptional regulator [Lachnospiraceae bacterium]|nr:BlaI/MecI/CopY family transcriptional regulator [Lachnospiraceae bacterium]
MIAKVFDSEYRFCLILWENEPVTSRELVKLCEEKLNWKRSTTFTVIRRLSERGIIKSENAVVTSLVSIDQVRMADAEEMIQSKFNGSLPLFINTFFSTQKLSENDVQDIEAMIEKYKEQNNIQ